MAIRSLQVRDPAYMQRRGPTAQHPPTPTSRTATSYRMVVVHKGRHVDLLAVGTKQRLTLFAVRNLNASCASADSELAYYLARTDFDAP